jgi:hypothetical protein
MKIDLTDDQYLHLLMALTMARDVLEDMPPWEISDAALHIQQLAVGGELYRQLVDLKKGVTLVTH